MRHSPSMWSIRAERVVNSRFAGDLAQALLEVAHLPVQRENDVVLVKHELAHGLVLVLCGSERLNLQPDVAAHVADQGVQLCLHASQDVEDLAPLVAHAAGPSTRSSRRSMRSTRVPKRSIRTENSASCTWTSARLRSSRPSRDVCSRWVSLMSARATWTRANCSRR